RYRSWPNRMMAVGGLLAIVGVIWNIQQFAFSWLIAFMFCLSICLGSLFLVLAHHLFDAGWSVAIRRFCEHLASMLFPWMAILFIPVALLAKYLYAWMSSNPSTDHALRAKFPLFTVPGFYIVSVLLFLIWWVLTRGLRNWSLKQDVTGGSLPTFKMR